MHPSAIRTVLLGLSPLLLIAGIAFLISARQLVCCLIACAATIIYSQIGAFLLQRFFGGDLDSDIAIIALLVHSLSLPLILAMAWMLAGSAVPKKPPFAIEDTRRRKIAVWAIVLAVLLWVIGRL